MISFLGPNEIIKYFKLYEIFHFTTKPWNDMDDETEKNITELMTQTNFNVLQFFEFTSLALNFFLCLDIVLTMRNPFYPHERRMKNYLPLSIIMAACAFSVSLKRVTGHETADDEAFDA